MTHPGMETDVRKKEIDDKIEEPEVNNVEKLQTEDIPKVKVKRKYKNRNKRPAIVYLCDECGHQSKSTGKMEEHKRTHWDIEPYSCTQCEFGCRDLQEMVQHAAEHVTATEKRYVCPQCEYECATYPMLLEHARQHSAAVDRPYACHECSYRSASVCALKKHQMGHAGVKPQCCPFCDYRCLAKSCLREHIATHTGEKHLLCSFCEYRTSSRSTMMRHIRRHTGDKPNKCPQCDYRSIQRITLHRHIKRKHTSQLFTLNEEVNVGNLEIMVVEGGSGWKQDKD